MMQWKKEKQIIGLAVYNSGTLTGLVALVIHVNYEKERRQNAPSPETNANFQ